MLITNLDTHIVFVYKYNRYFAISYCFFQDNLATWSFSQNVQRNHVSEIFLVK